jgi:hypothetical protein
MGTVPALQALSEVLDSLRPIADDLVGAVVARMLTLAPQVTRTGARSFADVDRDALALTQGIVNLLTEAFRMAVEDQAEQSVVDLMEPDLDAGLHVEDDVVIDIG